MKDKQKIGTALGARIWCGLNEKPYAPGLSLFFCGVNSQYQKNWGQFRRQECKITADIQKRLQKDTAVNIEICDGNSPHFFFTTKIRM